MYLLCVTRDYWKDASIGKIKERRITSKQQQKKQHNFLLLILVCYSHLIEDLTTTPIGEISKTVGLIMTYLNSHSKKNQ